MSNSDNIVPSPSKVNTRVIARNAAWMSLDAGFGVTMTTAISIAIARIIGKDSAGVAMLGSYQHVVLLTTITLAVGSFGLASTTQKYMAEYLNNGNPGVARATYIAMLKLQTLLAIGAAVLGFIATRTLADAQYRAAALLLVIAIVPRLVGNIPSQANNASEVPRFNTMASICGVAAISVLTAVSLFRGWGLLGLSAASLAGSTVECILKLYLVERRMSGIPRTSVAPELRKRILTYSGAEIALLALNLLVWDRSDILLLKALNPDRRQIAFFSFPFSLAERALLFPGLFAGALGFTMMAQHGRDSSRVRDMTADGGRYALLLALPLLVGMACVSRPLVLLTYGKTYTPMIPTVAIIALFAVPKALTTAPTFLLQTIEKQKFLVIWGCLCGVVDFGLDFLLVRRYGANGAAIANGSAQALAALGIWIYVWRIAKLDLALLDCGRILASAAFMALGVLGILKVLPGVLGLAVGVAAGVILWFVGLRLTGALRSHDVNRFLLVSNQLPASLRRLSRNLIAWLAPSARLS
jgi:O-antigen/teichoic acid export membrane protein